MENSLATVASIADKFERQNLNLTTRGKSNKLLSDLSLGGSGILTLLSFATPVTWVLPAGLFAGTCVYKLLTTGDINIPTKDVSFKTLSEQNRLREAVSAGEVPKNAVALVKPITARSSLSNKQEKLTHLLTGIWKDLVLPCMALRPDEESQILEFRRVLAILSESVELERFIDSPSDVDLCTHGIHGAGLAAFIKHQTEFIKRGYMNSIEVYRPGTDVEEDVIEADVVSEVLSSEPKELAHCVPQLPGDSHEVKILNRLAKDGLPLITLLQRPLVVYCGPSQSGKSTLAHLVNVARVAMGLETHYLSPDEDAPSLPLNSTTLGNMELAQSKLRTWTDQVANGEKGSLDKALVVDELFRIADDDQDLSQAFV